MNKKRIATARRLIFLEFLKAFIADLIKLLFSSLQNLKATVTAAIVVLTSNCNPSLFNYFFQFDLGCTSYNNPMPQSTLSPQSGTMYWASARKSSSSFI